MSHHFVLLVLLVWTVRNYACPTICQCKLGLIKCNGYPSNFSEIFDNFTEVAIIGLSDDEFGSFLNESIGAERVVIETSDISLENASFDNFPLLASLELSSDNIETFIWKTKLNNTRLKTLDISGNKIEVVKCFSFELFNYLQVLNISSNFITQIETCGFEGLLSLKELDISRNNLTSLPDDVFKPLKSLQFLNLSDNNLEVLSELWFFHLQKLQHLDLSFNKLIKTETFELPSLIRLVLTGNTNLGGSKEASVLVGNSRRLRIVEASNIGLKQIPSSLTHSIRTLKVNNNFIERISRGDLDSYPLVQLLDLSSNKIKYIEDDALGRLDSLTIIYLTSNTIQAIPKSLPERLTVLHLEYNNIETVLSQDMQGLSELEVLHLNDNKIRIIEAGAFTQLVSLVTLDLSRNPISILEAGCLAGPVALQVLRLSSIEIISPVKEVSFPLSTTEHLIILDLSSSPGLARQFLADTAALAACRELQELDISSVKLNSIRSDILFYLPQLRVLHVQNNQLNCTYLEWLASWMRQNDNAEYRTLTCHSPLELSGTPLIDLQEPEATKSIDFSSTTFSPGNKLNKTSTSSSELHTAINSTNFDKGHNNLTSNVIESGLAAKEINSGGVQKQNEINKTVYSTQLSASKRERVKVNTPVFSNFFAPSNDIKEKFFETNKETEPFPQRQSAVSAEKAASLKPTSMFATNEDNTKTILHPGMLILIIMLLFAAATLTLLAARFNRKRKNSRTQQAIEVSTLSSVTELW